MEGNSADVLSITGMLREPPYDNVYVVIVSGVRDAIEHLAHEATDVVLLDLGIDDGAGLDALTRLHAHAPAVPIMVLTARNDDLLALQAVRCGAEDCLSKGEIDSASLLRRVRFAIERRQARQESDVHDRQQEVSLEFSTQVLGSPGEGIVIVDLDERVISINQAFTTITGYTTAEIVGKTLSSLGEDAAAIGRYDEIWRAVDATGQWRGQVPQRRKSGETFPMLVSLSAVREIGDQHIAHYVCVIADISHSEQHRERFNFLTHHDPLTRLLNRDFFELRLEKAIGEARRLGRHLGLLFIDLDNFKAINDALGHSVGDALLKNVAAQILGCVHPHDTVARLGGDEFAILLDNLTAPQDAAVVAQRVLDRLALPFHHDRRELFSGSSIGLSIYPQDGTDAGTLLKNADTAMYRAKKLGRNTYEFFTPEMNARVLETMKLALSLREVVKRNQLVLEYQPRFELASRKLVAVEALLRWHHPELGKISPARFIPLAEETGMIGAIGDWALRQACVQARAWQDRGLAPLRVAVNISARQLLQADFAVQLRSALDHARLDPRWLELEITESSLMENPEDKRELFDQIKALGVSITLDDFGTGYSSLSYLKHFPVDYLKLDYLFVRDLPHDEDDVAIVRTIISVAKNLGIRVVAECIERQEQLEFMLREGCDEGQGFLLSYAHSAERLEQLLAPPLSTTDAH